MNKSSIVALLVCAVVWTGPVGAQAPAIPAFDSQTAPPAPDYSRSAAWAVRPGKPGASAVRPQGLKDVRSQHDVDVFYLQPTTFRSADRWNQAIDDKETNRWTDASVIARQASVFGECCRIFAPRFRQASFLASHDPMLMGDGGKAFAIAYSDVLAAFDYYMRHDNKGRPFILAGHSQGSDHLARLLADRIDGTPLADRMVAAYAIGLDLTEGAFGRTYKQLEPCRTPDQTGCVLGWNALQEGGDIGQILPYAGARYAARYKTQEGRQLLCINPLTFAVDRSAAPADLNLGAIPGPPDETAPRALQTGKVSAHCDRGFLVVEPARSLSVTPLTGGSLHYYDYALFYANIRANVAVRIAAWRKAHSR